MDLNDSKESFFAHSAVIALYERATDSLILTKRSEELRAHPGEVCFPGGAWEEEDKNLFETALRELYEELGITGDRVTLIRELDVETTLLGSIIHPWFASIESIIPYHINDKEVKRIISIPMPLVLDAQNYKVITVERNGFRFKSYELIYAGDSIWGATARIMKQLSI